MNETKSWNIGDRVKVRIEQREVVELYAHGAVEAMNGKTGAVKAVRNRIDGVLVTFDDSFDFNGKTGSDFWLPASELEPETSK
jgi:hypothetical protein